MFNLENSIQGWLRSFRKHRAFDYAEIQEMELHLRDHIEDLITEGYSEKEAFDLAVKNFGDVEFMAEEEFMVQKRKKSFFGVFSIFTTLKNFAYGIRYLRQNKGYTFINILSLSIGITASIIIFQYIFNELSFDKFHSKHDRIFRIISTFTESDEETNYSSTQIPLAEELQNNYPFIEHAVRILKPGRELFLNLESNESYYEEKFYYADNSIFDVFDFDLIKGNPKLVLDKPFCIVLTKSTALKYFGSVDVLGKNIEKKGKKYKVTGLMKDVPSNSHIDFDALLSFNSFPTEFAAWDSWFPNTYVLLHKDQDKSYLEGPLDRIKKEPVDPVFEKFGITVRYWAQPLSHIYLRSGFNDESEKSSDITFVYVFISIAGFLLLIAVINYINLATARATKRAKEIGVRKVLGSGKSDLIIKFMTESVILVAISVIVSIICSISLLPAINKLSEISLMPSDLIGIEIIWLVLLIIVLAGIGGGFYPAIYLSRFNAIHVLKRGKVSGRGNAGLRKLLVVFQFSMALIMIISTSIVYDQLTYLNKKDLGFNYNQVIIVPLSGSDVKEKSGVLMNQLKSSASVLQASSSTATPGKELYYSIMKIEGPEGEISRGVNYLYASNGYQESLELSIIKGRSFSDQYPTDSSAALINEAMLRNLGWKDPLGKQLRFDDGNPETTEPTYHIIGVIKDFHQKSLHNEIKPMAIFNSKNNDFLNIKVASNEINAALVEIEEIWQDVNPGYPFSYTFLDDDFRMQYENDQRRGELLSLFTLIAIFISCIGLFGLASYTAERRSKEIAIRKVVGANVLNISRLIFKEYVILIFISICIAFPIAYIFMSDWLISFAYQTTMEIHHFIGAAVLLFLVTASAVGYHTIKAARMNPVEVMKD